MKTTVAIIFLISCSAYFCPATYAQTGQQDGQNKIALPLPSPRKIDSGKIEAEPSPLSYPRLLGRPCYGDSGVRGNSSYEVVKQEPRIGIKAKGYPAYKGPKMNVGSTSADGVLVDYGIIFDGIEYDVTVNMENVIRRIRTDSPKFKTPEGIAVGDSAEKVLKLSNGKPANTKPCLYYLELKSGWRALFPQGEIRQDRTLAPDAKVAAFFKEH